MRSKILVVLSGLMLAACASGIEAIPGNTGLRSCGEFELPSAPESWYEDEPVYVGNEMPAEEVRRFASTLEGFVDIWIDRHHNGWVSVGFVGVDIESAQAALESRFADEGVVAVELAHDPAELDEISERLQAELPDDVDARNVDYLRGAVMVYGGVLTEARISMIEEAVGSDPVCVDGIDPDAIPGQGPQEPEGDGWVYFGVVDEWIGEVPILMTDQASLASLWEELQLPGEAPSVDFDAQVAVAFPVGYSGSCPDTRFEGLSVQNGRLMAVIAHTTVAQACTSDYNPRTYLIGLDRDQFPAPPFHVVEWEHSSQALSVTVDLRTPGQIIGLDGATQVAIDRVRAATDMPLVIEPGFPWTLTIPADCAVGYLGEINGIGWHTDLESMPDEWAASARDGLIDLELLLTEGPYPSLTATVGGVEVVYQPGDIPRPDCRR